MQQHNTMGWEKTLQCLGFCLAVGGILLMVMAANMVVIHAMVPRLNEGSIALIVFSIGGVVVEVIATALTICIIGAKTR